MAHARVARDRVYLRARPGGPDWSRIRRRDFDRRLLGLLPALDPDHRGLCGADVAGLCRRESTARRRILLAGPVLDARDDADGDGWRFDHHLPRTRNHVARGLCAGRDAPARPALERSGDEIFPARRIFDRLPALWDRAYLRRDRDDQARTDPRGAGEQHGLESSADARAGDAAHRVRLQDRRGPISYVDARRVRGRAHADNGLHGGWSKARRVRRFRAGLPDQFRAGELALGDCACGCWPRLR